MFVSFQGWSERTCPTGQQASPGLMLIRIHQRFICLKVSWRLLNFAASVIPVHGCRIQTQQHDLRDYSLLVTEVVFWQHCSTGLLTMVLQSACVVLL